jgi:cytochrome P450
MSSVKAYMFHGSKHKVPPGPRGHLVFGVGRELQQDVLGFGLKMHQQYGDLVRYRFIGRYGYQVNHPEYIKHILQDNHHNYQKSKAIVTRFDQLVGNGLLLSEGDFWLRQRRLAQPAFHRKRIAAFGAIMTGAAEAALDHWSANEDQPLDVAEEMTKLTLQVAGQTLFGLDLLDHAKEVGEAFGDVSAEVISFPRSYVVARMLLPWLPIPTPRNRRFDEGLRTLDRVVQGIIVHRRKHNEEREDLLSMFMSACDEETGERMDDRQLRDEVMTMLLAGHETTALALTWTWYLLSQHPDVEHKLHAELDTVLQGSTPTLNNLSNLPYTRSIVEEVLRLYPPAHSFNRQATADDEIGGYHIPAGAHMLIQPYVVHRHPAFWEHPEVFNPERFMPERSHERHRYAFIPFSGGPRQCIGNTFALAEAQLVIATIAQRYRLRLVPGHPVETVAMITLRPRHGLKMTLHRR